VVEQPIRNRQVASSTLALGSICIVALYRGVIVTFSRICLTWVWWVIYRNCVGVMKRDFELGPELSQPRRRAALCFVLVALLLYNPFFTILGNSLDLSVQHPLSYRATVAGTELQRGMLEASNPLVPELTAAILHAASLFSPSHKIAFVHPSDTGVPVSLAICDSIWFRPPPAN
jgi:hypothetical protein